MRFSIITLLIGVTTNCVFSLQPSKLPSGKPRKYRATKSKLTNDLNVLTATEASFISKHWLNNILQAPQICHEDIHIVENINKLEEHIQDSFSDNSEQYDTYIAWVPPGYTRDVLFLIVLREYKNKNILKLLIHSPFWESAQIESQYLYDALNYYSIVNHKTLDTDEFFDENIRYKFEWGYGLGGEDNF